jgi:uncharacterized repeat protein (TIGR03803 family)
LGTEEILKAFSPRWVLKVNSGNIRSVLAEATRLCKFLHVEGIPMAILHLDTPCLKRQPFPGVLRGFRMTQRIGSSYLPRSIGVLITVAFFAFFLESRQVNAQILILNTFTGPNGSGPNGTLIADSSGNLYGTTVNGGVHGFGTVFELPVSGEEQVLYSFEGGADGANPSGILVRDNVGDLYGTTSYGGSFGGLCVSPLGCGVVFEVNPKGKERVLYAFTGGSDGSNPESGLILDAAGNFYGTTTLGGNFTGQCAGGCGVVFKLQHSGIETVLYSFNGPPDGDVPYAGLVRDMAGNLYGTTQDGGSISSCFYCGTVFKLDALGNETVLYSFSGAADGGQPAHGALILDQSGNLYGTTMFGGDDTCESLYGCGVIFELDSSGDETVLHTFTGSIDGAYPTGGLIRDAKGNIYGTSLEGGGGNNNSGTVFKLDSGGTLNVLHQLVGTDGSNPAVALLPYKGYLYGTTLGGGGALGEDDGVVFRLLPK